MSMNIGVNLPWFDGAYCHDLGRNLAYPDYPVNFNKAQVEELLCVLSSFRIRYLQIWLFENREGIIYDEEGEINGVDSIFLQNIKELVPCPISFGS